MTQPRKILIAGDADLRATLAEQFHLYPEFALSEAGTPDSALEALQRQAPDILLVAGDLEPPGAGELIAAARAAGFTGAVIVLDAGAGAAPPGADERVARPFRFADLLTRLRARGSEALIGTDVFHPDSLLPTGARARLTEKEGAILARLARAKGAAVPKEVLLRDVWGYNPGVTTRTLETHIHRLRRKIEADPARPRVLLTEQGGYRLTDGGAPARADEG
jgi:DNA-binding response OmpR family regulator